MSTKLKSLILFSNHFKVRLFFALVGAKRIAIKMALKIVFKEKNTKRLSRKLYKSGWFESIRRIINYIFLLHMFKTKEIYQYTNRI